MLIGVPKETKSDEYRVAIVPAGVELLVKKGHQVLVEENAGLGGAIPGEGLKEVGATICPSIMG